MLSADIAEGSCSFSACVVPKYCHAYNIHYTYITLISIYAFYIIIYLFLSHLWWKLAAYLNHSLKFLEPTCDDTVLFLFDTQNDFDRYLIKFVIIRFFKKKKLEKSKVFTLHLSSQGHIKTFIRLKDHSKTTGVIHFLSSTSENMYWTFCMLF